MRILLTVWLILVVPPGGWFSILWFIRRADVLRAEAAARVIERERIECDRLALLPINPCPLCDGSGESPIPPLREAA